jgi:outer membrane protein OmpA-like peptidoglycan-associated protein
LPSYNNISAESSAVLREATFGISFETDSDKVKKESSTILNKLYKTVASGNEHILITGHTDSQGCSIDNQKLSEARAFSVYKYLIAKGIPSSRISYEGLGDTQPIEDNCTNKSRSKNRRVEFRIQ